MPRQRGSLWDCEDRTGWPWHFRRYLPLPRLSPWQDAVMTDPASAREEEAATDWAGISGGGIQRAATTTTSKVAARTTRSVPGRRTPIAAAAYVMAAPKGSAASREAIASHARAFETSACLGHVMMPHRPVRRREPIAVDRSARRAEQTRSAGSHGTARAESARVSSVRRGRAPTTSRMARRPTSIAAAPSVPRAVRVPSARTISTARAGSVIEANARVDGCCGGHVRGATFEAVNAVRLNSRPVRRSPPTCCSPRCRSRP